MMPRGFLKPPHWHEFVLGQPGSWGLRVCSQCGVTLPFDHGHQSGALCPTGWFLGPYSRRGVQIPGTEGGGSKVYGNLVCVPLPVLGAPFSFS